MKNETRQCQNCKNDFIIEPEDFKFYEKIKVPPPTFCPECRLVRRLIWRNERSLYKRSCDLCNKKIISMYDENVAFPVYCPECWKSDLWDPISYGFEYDFSKPFFEQWKKLFEIVPRQSLLKIGNSLDSDYCNYAKDPKRIYLSYSSLSSEDVYYSSNIDKSKGIIDSYNIVESELLYENIGCVKNYECQYCYWSSNCINSNFLLDCMNCSNCFGCVNLRNKSYCIWNEQYTREDYFNKLKDFNLGSFSFVQKFFEDFYKFSYRFPRKFQRTINCVNSIGDDLRDCRNVVISFKTYDSQDIKYGYRNSHAKDSMDVCHSWAELGYEHATGGSENSSKVRFIITGSNNSSEIEYSDFCQSSNDLFGCIGLKSKKYCILNKQYTKEEYEELIPRIKQHMMDMPYIDKNGLVYKYGEFFPNEFSPFGYNETSINDHFPLTKEEALEKKYFWKDKLENKYIVTKKDKDLPDDIKNVDESILNEVIECIITKKPFKILPFEFEFYKKMNIPIPRVHYDQRYKNRLSIKNPMKLWHRKCMKEGCNNEFETSYAPERKELVYCERCYQQEVY